MFRKAGADHVEGQTATARIGGKNAICDRLAPGMVMSGDIEFNANGVDDGLHVRKVCRSENNHAIL